MNLLKCAFRVFIGKFMGFLDRNRGINVDSAKATTIETTNHNQRVKELFGQGLLHKEAHT